jgi:hypothetical protein
MQQNDHKSSSTIAMLSVGTPSSVDSQRNADKMLQQADPRQPLSPHGSVFPSPGTNLRLLLSSTTKHTLRSVEHILHPKSRAANATFAAFAERLCHIGLNRHLLRQTIFLLL